jgi:hypothetical protein
MVVYGEGLADKTAILHFKDITEAVGVHFVGTKEAKVGLFGITHVDVAHQLAQLAC